MYYNIYLFIIIYIIIYVLCIYQIWRIHHGYKSRDLYTCKLAPNGIICVIAISLIGAHTDTVLYYSHEIDMSNHY